MVVRVHEGEDLVLPVFEVGILIVGVQFPDGEEGEYISLTHIMPVIGGEAIGIVVHFGRLLVPEPDQLEDLPAIEASLHRPLPQHQPGQIMPLIVVLIGGPSAANKPERRVGREDDMGVVDGAEVGQLGGVRALEGLHVEGRVGHQRLPFVGHLVERLFCGVDVPGVDVR